MRSPYSGSQSAARRGSLAIICCKFFFGGGCEPVAGFLQFFLHSGLLEEVRHVGVFGKVYYAFAADYIAGPLLVAEIVEAVEVEWTSTEVHKSLDTVFFSFSFSVVMVVAVAVLASVAAFFVFMFMLMFMLMLMMVMFMFMVVVFVVGVGAFDFAYPCGRCGHVFEVEHAGVE